MLVPAGEIEVICGCMFSGKTGLLISRVDLALRLGLPVQVFKHAMDDRYDCSCIVTHSGQSRPAVPVADSADVLAQAGSAVVLIDEAQFFDPHFPEVCQSLAQAGRRVIAAGLDLDSWGQPFGNMPRLAEIAQRVTRIAAVCALCGARAEYTQRLAPVVESNMIGGKGCYEPRCMRCFLPPPAHLRR